MFKYLIRKTAFKMFGYVGGTMLTLGMLVYQNPDGRAFIHQYLVSPIQNVIEHGVEMPDLEMPSVPKVSIPDVELPKNIPSVEVASLEGAVSGFFDRAKDTVSDMVGRIKGGNSSSSSPLQAGVDDSGMPKVNGMTFYRAKKYLYKIHARHPVTIYSGCIYNTRHKVDWKTCNYQPRKNKRRGRRVEMEHMVPASWFGHNRPCWKKGGRKYCSEHDPVFQMMEGDMHNLVPAIGEINGDRKAMPYGIVQGERRAYGAVDFEINWRKKVAEPAPNVRGDVARATLYMAWRYHVPMSKAYLDMMQEWSLQDPPDEWERYRNKMIARIQGNENPFIQ